MIAGLRVWYRVAGDVNAPPLVFLNGWGARWSGWWGSDRVIRMLAESGFRVWSPEHPGLMRSQTPRTIWGANEYAAYVREFCRELAIPPAIMVGQSFGGSIAAHFAATYPDALQLLVLVDSGIAGIALPRFSRTRLTGPLARALRLPMMPAFLKRLIAALGLGIPWDMIPAEDYTVRSRMGDILQAFSLPDTYVAIRVPVAFVWGDRDRLIPPSRARRAAERQPRALFVTVRGGHSVLYQYPERVLPVIMDVIRAHSPG